MCRVHAKMFILLSLCLYVFVDFSVSRRDYDTRKKYCSKHPHKKWRTRKEESCVCVCVVLMMSRCCHHHTWDMYIDIISFSPSVWMQPSVQGKLNNMCQHLCLKLLSDILLVQGKTECVINLMRLVPLAYSSWERRKKDFFSDFLDAFFRAEWEGRKKQWNVVSVFFFPGDKATKCICTQFLRGDCDIKIRPWACTE